MSAMPRAPIDVGDSLHDAERDLLVRHRNGDAQAFAELVARYRRPVYGYLLRCGLEAAVCDDLFQEVFATIHRAAGTYQSDRPVRPWVFTITANVVRSYYRGTRLREVALQPDDCR